MDRVFSFRHYPTTACNMHPVAPYAGDKITHTRNSSLKSPQFSEPCGCEGSRFYSPLKRGANTVLRQLFETCDAHLYFPGAHVLTPTELCLHTAQPQRRGSSKARNVNKQNVKKKNMWCAAFQSVLKTVRSRGQNRKPKRQKTKTKNKRP